MTFQHNPPHWNYYRLLERDLEECFRFVEPSKAHYEVYSDHFARIILMACAEIENCLASFAFWSQCQPKPSSISSYHGCVTAKFPRFTELEIIMPRYSLGIHPWKDWTSSNAPDWWTNGYNKIKHDRMNHPSAPTMIRAIRSVGALLVLLLHFYRLRFRACEFPAENAPELMHPWVKEEPWLDASVSWSWELPGEGQQ